MSHFVTDAAPPARLRRICEDHGVVLDIAAEGSSKGQARA
jgi:hypothetical protein